MLQRNDFPRSQSDVRKDDEIDVFALLGALWRGKLILTLCALIGLLLGGYYAYGVASPVYRATSSLALNLNTNPMIADIEAIVSGASTEDAAMNTEIQVIQSRGVIEQLVDELDLMADPEFNTALQPEPVFSPATLVNALETRAKDILGIAPERITEEEKAISMRNDTVKSVRSAIDATVMRDTYIFNIGVNTSSPQKSQRIANTLANIYISDQVAQKFAATEGVVDWLSERLTDLESELREREDELKIMRTEVDVVSVEGLKLLNRQLIDARDRLADATQNVERLDTSLGLIAEFSETGDYAALADELDDDTLSDLVARSADPQTIRSRVERLAAQQETLRERQRQQVRSLQGALDRLEREVEIQSDDLVQLQQIEREVQATRTLYETFLARLKEATVQRGLAQSDSRVLSAAIPGQYIAPQKPVILTVSALLGALVGLAFVLARQFLSKGYRTISELETDTGHTIIGQIPLMPIRQRPQLLDYLRQKTNSAGVEAIRNLRTSILLSSEAQEPKVIVSCSSLPGEGKTTMAISLAVNMANLNKKVLLIEGDVRRKTLDEYFRHAGQKTAGIVTAMQADTIEEIKKIVFHEEAVGFDILLGEKVRQNAADLFSSGSFSKFIELVRTEYDYIIIDTPPVLVVPDARVIGQHADAIIFNVAWNRTSRVQVHEALRQFETARLDVTGLVLNQVDPAGMKRYGYGGKYGSYAAYGSGYYDT